MLILSRGEDEAIIIGNDVEITVLGIKSGAVKLGINAPGNVEVHRSEVFIKVQRENYEQRRSTGKS